MFVPTQSSTSPLEEISDLDLNACVELLPSISSLPKEAVRPRAVLKIHILFVADYGSTP